MSDFAHFGGSEEEYAAVRKHNADVEANPDSFEHWEALIAACEALEGGINRNSSPAALETFRDAYDRFLHKFPLLFGYWSKYAEFEFSIAGPESAEMVYERGVASVSNSVDLWLAYCNFKTETTHDPQLVRELFERGANAVGLDFMAHIFWDRYIDYEGLQEAHDRIYALHARVVRIPLHQYARYYERFRVLALERPLTELASADIIAKFRSEVESEYNARGIGEQAGEAMEREIRTKVDAMFYEIFASTQGEVGKRWTYESEIKRPYFHVTELDQQQLSNWQKYLDFEEQEGDFARITTLYERCLTTCALYEEFWLRYARWMSGQDGKEEEVRNIYRRACTVFVPVSRPGIRLQWAYFEEAFGRVDVALAIHEALLDKIPDCIEIVTSWANVARRQSGLEAAVQVYRDQIDTPTVDLYTKAALVAEWAYLLWKTNRSADEARAVFLKNVQWYADSRIFWDRWFQFELEQPGDEDQEERVAHVFEDLRNKSRLPTALKLEYTKQYLEFLVQRGSKDAMKTYLQVDREMFGPTSVSYASRSGTNAKENGASRGELDEQSIRKATAKSFAFYELYGEPTSDAQIPTDFN
ncbi:unnamed protein product [Clonostachys rhizophaga]|uniref:Pre-mRNA-processing factor 39 n=1 Tax=Clonostachys rhizophaga TaxID=160324 RepID=A0A9N9YHV8_9HYPO|nr:unnamed protein product [Clonostachys rhizophaga]